MLESPIAYNGLTLNDQSKRSLNVAPYYWYRIFTVDGIWDQEVRFETHERPHRDGAKSGDAYYNGKTLVISGRIYAKNLQRLREAQRALQYAFYDMQDHQLVFTLWGEQQVYITCRKNQKLDMPENQADLGPSFKRDFTIQLYADDPHMYAVGGSAVYPIWS